jgi:hypothetical protein
LLPGERELLYFAKAPQGSPENAIYIQNLASGKRDRIIQSGTRALWSPPGYLLFTQDQNLMAQPLNLSSHRLSGQPVTIAKDVSVNEPNGRSTIAASLNGVLAYRSSLGLDRRLVWHDRNGKAISTVARAGPHRQPVLSPNGATLAILSGSSSSSQDLWTIDLASGATTELTFDRHLDPNNFPVWSPDSRSVAVSPQGGGIEVVTVASADVRVLSKDPIVVQDWSPDGRSILCTDIQEHHVLLAPVDRPQEPKTIITSPLAQWGFHFAPGGAAVVYITSESGDQSAYVASFPSFAEKRRVSPGTAAYPVWNANGRLYYSSGGSIWEVEIRTAPHLGVGQPRALFPSAYGRFAVAAGAQKFLTLDPLQDQREELMIIQNWAVGMNRP